MANNYSNAVQLPIDGWSGNSGSHPPFSEKMKKKKDMGDWKLQCDHQLGKLTVNCKRKEKRKKKKNKRKNQKIQKISVE